MTSTQTKTACPQCGGELVERRAASGTFLGCKGFPRCRYVAPRGATPAPSPAIAPRPAAGPVVGTEQQQAFWDTILRDDAHVMLTARAGCGKTFSIIHAAKLYLETFPTSNARIAFAAFNTDIATELKGKMPAGAEALTLHSLGNRAITNALGRAALDKEGEKVRTIVQGLSVPTDCDSRGRVHRMLGRAATRLIELCKGALATGTQEELDTLVASFDIEVDPTAVKLKPGQRGLPYSREQFMERLYQIVPSALELCKAEVGLIDFNDMIWLPVVLGLPVPTYDLLFIDESQDMNRCQQELAFMACPSGRIVIVGDDRQAIYGFRGADSTSMDTMARKLERTGRELVRLPLTLTRRCPKSVVELAQGIVPDIEAMPDAPAGIIDTIEPGDLVQEARAGDMILCRTNAPLVATAYQFIRAGRNAIIKGRDLSGTIKELIDQLRPDPETTASHEFIRRLGETLSKFRIIETNRLTEMGKAESVIASHEDRCECLGVLLEGCVTEADLMLKIESIFAKKSPNGAVILSTAHGAKGLESDTVFIIRPELMPFPKVKEPAALLQEMNLKYVAITRSKRRLVFVREAGAGAGDETEVVDSPGLDFSAEDTGIDVPSEEDECWEEGHEPAPWRERVEHYLREAAHACEDDALRGRIEAVLQRLDVSKCFRQSAPIAASDGDSLMDMPWLCPGDEDGECEADYEKGMMGRDDYEGGPMDWHGSR